MGVRVPPSAPEEFQGVSSVGLASFLLLTWLPRYAIKASDKDSSNPADFAMFTFPPSDDISHSFCLFTFFAC